MSGWPIASLGSVVKFISGGTPSKDESRFWDGDIPWVSSAEMTQRWISDTQLHVTEDGARTGSKRVPANTVLVVVRGMSLAKEFRVAISQRDVTFNQDLKAVLPSKALDPVFLFFYLLSQNAAIRDSASEAAHGTKKLDMPVLEQWPIPIPPLKSQQKIAAILSTYDDLIANNQRRIALLERMAENIYREWFVRLRFPGREHVPAEKDVPRGWRAVRFSEICSFEKGKNPSTLFDTPMDGALPYLNVETLENVGISYAARAKNAIVCCDDDVLMLMDGARSGFVFRGRAGIVSSTFALVRTDSRFKNIIFEYLKAGKDAIVFNNTGSAIPHANKEFINRMMMFLPVNDALVEQFNAQYRSIFRQAQNLAQQNVSLTRTRDALLPRLISGKLAVDGLDIRFPPGMPAELDKNPVT